MSKQIIIVGIALLGLPSLLEAQARAGAGADVRLEAAEAGEDRGAGRVGAHAAVRAALAAGLPDEPVRRVIAEGEAKSAARSSVDRAAASVLLRLRASREALDQGGAGGEPSRAEVVAGAEALAAGASREDLESLRGAAPAGRSLVASLNALAELRARGMDGGTAAARIAARLAGGAPDRAIAELGAAVEATAGAGADAAGISDALGAGASGHLSGAGSAAVGIGASVVGSLPGGSR